MTSAWRILNDPILPFEPLHQAIEAAATADLEYARALARLHSANEEMKRASSFIWEARKRQTQANDQLAKARHAIFGSPWTEEDQSAWIGS